MREDVFLLSTKELKKYCRKVFCDFSQKLNIERKTRFLALRLPFVQFNGLMLSVGLRRKRVDIVVINLYPYRPAVITSPQMAYFFLHSVVAHEAKHIQLLQNWQNGVVTYEELFSEWSLRQICKGVLPERIVQQYLVLKGSSDLKKRRHAVSPIELLCYEYGFREAFQHFAPVLSPEEHRVAQTVVESIGFINQNIEIDYYSSMQAYNRFTHTITNLARYLGKDPNAIKKFPQLLVIFTPDGFLKSPIQIFAERSENNAHMVDSVLIRLFITMVFDWTELFSRHEDLYNHIAVLANDYCANAVDYLKNIALGEVFLHKDILQDNAAMLIKNVNTLNRAMDKYGMAHTTGSVLPIYYFDDFSRERR